MAAYYNEIDPLKAEILREAIADGAIAPGDVDERSIADVRGDDLRGYTQCHFFAGGGFWSLAARLAGWPDDEPLWSGSSPCPSFSAAGKGAGFDDPRHLWPDWARLIRERRPAVVFGEQADDAVGFGWLDLVQTDLEAQAYAVGKIVFGAHSVGAPHIRQRLYFCADAEEFRGRTRLRDSQPGEQRRVLAPDDSGAGSLLPLHEGVRLRESGYRASSLQRGVPGSQSEPEAASGLSDSSQPRGSDAGQRADADGGISGDRDIQRGGKHGLFADRGTGSGSDAGGARSPELRRRRDESARPAPGDGTSVCVESGSEGLQGHGGAERASRGPGWLDQAAARSAAAAGATRGFWGDCDWWYGRDGLYRAIGPGLFPLAHGSPARVGRLRLYGDAIVVPQAAEFLKAYREARGIVQ